MRRIITAALGLCLLCFTTAHAVENTWDPAVQVSATVQASPAKITLSWPQDTNGVPSSYTIFRKSPTSSDWGAGTTISGSSTSYTDTSVTAGDAFEYRIVKASSGYTGYGYITAGIEAPLVDSRGKVVLVVDNTVASSLASELTRLEQDLRGDGWVVVRRDVNRTDSPASVKAVIKAVYDSDPANVKSVFLFGRIPVPYSGQLNPDGHPDHIGAWPADVYYGDMNGNWTDSSVNYTQTINTNPADAARISNVPGDGKFDQTTIPSTVELEVGRVDLSKMPGRLTWGGPATFPAEIELLRKYLNKDHNFRHRKSNTVRRAVVGDYFGYRGGEAFAASAFRSFAPLVGANNVRNLNIEFNDQRGVWVPQVAANDYLLAYGCGAGSYDSISGLGNALNYNGASTPEMVNSNVRGVFNLLFGSWLGDWDSEDNFLRSTLLTDSGLAAVWSGRPHWFMHPLGLGATLGQVTRLTQNNAGQYQTIVNSAENRIHIALMGDPTLRLHPVVPATDLNGSASGSTAALTWSASTDSNIVGYHVYRASSATGSFTRLTSSPVSATNYTDNAAFSGATYMVRAVKLETAASGSYYNAAQGAFWTVGTTGTTTPPASAPATDSTAPTIAISAPAASATVSGSVNVTATANDNVGIAGVQFKLDGANLGGEVTNAPYSSWLNTTTLTNGTHTLTAVARDAAGNMATATTVSINVSNTVIASGGTSSGTTTTSSATIGTTETTTSATGPTAPSGTVVWIDDALPAGSGGLGTRGGDTWNWVSSGPAPVSGAKAHKSDSASGHHEHWFGWTGTPLVVNTGEVLVTYVYLDPANPPSQIMLSWHAGNWEHRAYWGANNIDAGTDKTPSRFYMGPLPAAGQWVRLEVPAASVGLENASVTGMGFGAYNGAVTWDCSGKALPTIAPITVVPTVTVAATDASATPGSTTDNAVVTFSRTGSTTASLVVGLTLSGTAQQWTDWYRTPEGDVPTTVTIPAGATSVAMRIAARSSAPNGSTAGFTVASNSAYIVGTPATATVTFGTATTSSTTPTTTTTEPTASATTTASPTTSASSETIWFDDALPAGAGGLSSSGGDSWNWITSNPAPASGSKAHQTNLAAGLHEHWFGWSSAPLVVAAGDTMFAYVYIDPANVPSQIMLSWSSNNWEHRAYWGANKIDRGANGSAGRYYVGPIPAAGQWIRLEVPASAVGLEGHSVTAMGFALVDGSVTWDKTGKFTGSSTTTTPTTTTSPTTTTTTSPTTTTTTTSPTTSTTTTTTSPTTSTTTSTTTTSPTASPTPTTSTPTVSEIAWFDDELPTGAGGMSASGGDSWNWVTSTPTPYSGTKAHKSATVAGQHEHWFGWSSGSFAVGSGDVLFTYVYLDPASPPSEIMLSWSTSSGWDQRAYWGANKIDRGANGTASRYYMGPLPPTGKWVRLEVPASAVNLAGRSVTSMGFALFDGGATWDKTGRFTGTAAAGGYTVPSTSTTDTTAPTTTTPTTTAATDSIWIDDALPAGAGGMSGSNGDGWNWVTSNPTPVSGTKAHQSNVAAGLHEHWFGWSGAPMAVAAGDKLFAYVYLDPANTPTEIMLSWSADNWEHRAYWGANRIDRGANGTASRYYAGALPAAGQWVRLEVPASAVGLEGQTVSAMGFAQYDGRATWDKTGKSTGGSSSTTTTSPTSPTTTTPTTTTPTTTTPTTTTPTTTTPTSPTTLAENASFLLQAVGSNQLRVISPTVLELQRITADATTWNFVAGGTFNAPATSSFTVKVNGTTVAVSAVNFRRRAIYAPLEVRDLRVDNSLYLTLSSAIPESATVEVTNPSATLWPSTMKFATSAHPLRTSPAIHVNQEGYVPAFPKKAMIGYYLGNGGELTVDAGAGFKIVNASTGAVVHTGALTARKDVGYSYAPLPYQKVLQADFSTFATPGEYQLVVPGLGASLPFVINEGIAMGTARTYALGLYHQRCGADNALPFTRFTHAQCHHAMVEVPASDSAYSFTWGVIASESSNAKSNPRHTAPQLKDNASSLYPFVNKGPIDVTGGHHDAGDYSKYTTNVAALVHNLMFTVDAIAGAAALDNLGIPQSGDGKSDIMQEAKHEADFLAKMQDADGGFYFLVYPKNRRYEDSLPEAGEPQVVWPKTTAATAASVAALAQIASSPKFKAAYPTEAAAYLAKAKLGWQFLINAISKHGKDGSYQKITHYGDLFMHDDELAWAACELFLATGEAQYHAKLMEWFPNPAATSTMKWDWLRLTEAYGAAIRSYAFAVRSGRLSAGQLNASYLTACETQVKLAGDDQLRWSNENAYGTSFPDHTKRVMAAGWYFGMDQAADMAAAYQLQPRAEYIDAIVANMNYEAGTNPVNVAYLTGIGLRRQHQLVNQYASHDHRRLPPSGFPIGNVSSEYPWSLPFYTRDELNSLTFPSDVGSTNVTPFYDRWTDVWNVQNEFVTVNQSRALTSAAFLAAQTSAKSNAWKPSVTAKIVATAATMTVGTPITLSLDPSGLDLSGARITWEVKDQMPDFGATFIATPKTTGAHWAEAEIAWPDGRRVFATGTFNVQ